MISDDLTYKEMENLQWHCFRCSHDRVFRLFINPCPETIANDSILYSIIKIVLLQPLKCRLSSSVVEISPRTVTEVLYLHVFSSHWRVK